MVALLLAVVAPLLLVGLAVVIAGLREPASSPGSPPPGDRVVVLPPDRRQALHR